jgi:hypothetical protein
MLRDNLAGLIEPMLGSAGAYPLALCTARKKPSDDRPPCLENPRPEGAESTLTENAPSPFHAEPRHARNTMCGDPSKSPLRRQHTSLQQVHRTAFGSSRLRIRFHRMRRSGVYLPSRNNRTVRGFPMQSSSVLRPAIFFGRFSVERCPTAIKATDLSATARDPSRSTLGHGDRKRGRASAPRSRRT